jgi:hypothetical protein
MWLERKRFSALELGPDEGIIGITTGVKAADLGDQEEEAMLHTVFSMNRRGSGGVYQHRTGR